MTSNPEVATVKNSQRMTRSQSKRIREEKEENHFDIKRSKTESLIIKLSSSSSPISITKTADNPNLFNIIKQMSSSQDELKSAIRKAKLRNTKEQQKHRQTIAEVDRKREELWDELEVSQGAYVDNRNVLWALHREIQNLKTRIKEVRGEEVIIDGNQVCFRTINEE